MWFAYKLLDPTLDTKNKAKLVSTPAKPGC